MLEPQEQLQRNDVEFSRDAETQEGLSHLIQGNNQLCYSLPSQFGQVLGNAAQHLYNVATKQLVSTTSRFSHREGSACTLSLTCAIVT